jgi:aminoglycoside 3'-phosphotransferase-2
MEPEMTTAFTTPILPRQLASLLDRTHIPIALGRSDASTWRIEGGGETLFLKAEPLHPLAELAGEGQRLKWLAGTPVAAPSLRDLFEADGFTWLLMTALPGSDLTNLVDHPELLCKVLATGLRTLHEIDPAQCPFDHRLEVHLADGAANVAAGRVDESDFDSARDGWTAVDVLDWLLAHRPATEDLVVTHGDASLPNIMAHDGMFSGVIDVGRLGVADRWQDLAITCRSIIYNCGQDHVAPFLAAYGADWDAARYRYYCTLDELF